MTLLLLYLALAVGVSFLCSLCEAALLTLTVSDAEVLAKSGSRAGAMLRAMKTHIDRPLAAILTLNTIANTFGAAGVGAQAAHVFGSGWVGLTSAALTLTILVCSEIIPKTIGANYARPLAAPTAWLVTLMIWGTWPIVILLNLISRAFKRSASEDPLTREQIEVIAEMARTGGALHSAESKLLTNMLRLQQIRVEDVMTPRTVVFMLPGTLTARGALDEHAPIRFSRIPVTGENPDDVLGIVLRNDIHAAVLRGNPESRLDAMLRPIRAVPERATLLHVMEQFAETGHHLFLVVDEYGGTAGVISLEDVLESILGAEIVDETDPVPDMRQLAAQEEPPADAPGEPDAAI